MLVLKMGDPAGPYATLADAQAAGAVTMNYGFFINTVVSFVITALAVFIVVKAVNRLKREEKAPPPPAPTDKECPFCFTKIPIKATRCPHCTSQLDA
jgi:large conductance mechanosensitive channel